MSDGTYAKHTVVANLEPLVPGTQWAVVERAFRAGSGLLVRFDARLVPGAARHLERLAALGDPQLATPVEHGVEDDEAWVLYAGTLDDALDAYEGPLSMGEILQLGDALVAGLERAHEQGFVHPGITSSVVRMHIAFDGRVHPELLGVGLPTLTPRAVQDDLADVAALLYTLYTGRPPFEPGSPRDESQRPKSLSELRPGASVPVAFEGAIMRALGPRRDAFWSASELRHALAVVSSRRTGRSQRATVTTDPNLPRLRREISVVEPLPVASTIPSTLPAAARSLIEPSDRSATWQARRLDQPPAPRRRAWLAVAIVLLLGLGVTIAIVAGGEGGEPMVAAAPAPPSSAPPIEPTVGAAPGVSTPEPAKPGPTRPAPPVVDAVVPTPAEPAAAPAPEPAAPSPPAPPAPPAMTRVSVSTDPSEAHVTLGGKDLGTTPLTIELGPGDLPARLVIERRGYAPAERTITELAGPTMDLAFALRPRARAAPKAPPATHPPPAGPIILGR